MSNATVTTLTTLRELFLRASSDYPSIRCALLAAILGESDQLNKGAKRYQREEWFLRMEPLLVRGDERRSTIVGELFVHTPILRQDFSREENIVGAERLMELAGRAGATLLNAPDMVWDRLKPTEADFAEDLGVANDLWLHDDRVLYRRESALRARAQHEERGGDPRDVVVPSADKYFLRRFSSVKTAELWIVALFNLAWLSYSIPSGDSPPILAKREVWHSAEARAWVSFDTADDLQSEQTAEFMTVSPPSPRLVEKPLRWFRSTLEGDPFLASAHGIDVLVSVSAPAMSLAEWKPTEGFIGAKTLQAAPYCVPGATLDYWVKRSTPDVVERDPRTRERYFPPAWVRERLRQWNRRADSN